MGYQESHLKEKQNFTQAQPVSYVMSRLDIFGSFFVTSGVKRRVPSVLLSPVLFNPLHHWVFLNVFEFIYLFIFIPAQQTRSSRPLRF